MTKSQREGASVSKVWILTEYDYPDLSIVGVFAEQEDAVAESEKRRAQYIAEQKDTALSVSSFDVAPKQTPVFIPEGWTVEQTKSAIRVSQNQNVPFDWHKWKNFGDYIGLTFPGGMFIGIEKDGYAHT